MDPEDLEPRSESAKPKDLEPMSLEALNDYIAELEAEIVRAKGLLAAKESSRGSAETFFKK